MKLRRFTPADIETIRLMASCGYPATAIAAKLGREPLAVRTKMVALGLPLRRRGKPKNGSRFMIPDRLWTEISVAAAKRNVKPTKLYHPALEANRARQFVGRRDRRVATTAAGHVRAALFCEREALVSAGGCPHY